MQLHGPGHLEAVTWVQVNHSAAGLLYAGGQAAGTVHVHSLDFEKGKANFVEQFSLPAPNPGDLSGNHFLFIRLLYASYFFLQLFTTR
jgi:hypothetical protein